MVRAGMCVSRGVCACTLVSYSRKCLKGLPLNRVATHMRRRCRARVVTAHDEAMAGRQSSVGLKQDQGRGGGVLRRGANRVKAKAWPFGQLGSGQKRMRALTLQGHGSGQQRRRDGDGEMEMG